MSKTKTTTNGRQPALSDAQLDRIVGSIVKKNPERKLGGVVKIFREQGHSASHKRIAESMKRVSSKARATKKAA